MLAQLESKILDLQSQIQATQAKITDYQTNPAYIKQEIYYEYVHNLGREWPRYYHINTKTAELAQAQTQLAALQNELKATQSQYEQKKQRQHLRALALQQAFIYPPPTSKNLPSQKVLKSIESLQKYLAQDLQKAIS